MDRLPIAVLGGQRLRASLENHGRDVLQGGSAPKARSLVRLRVLGSLVELRCNVIREAIAHERDRRPPLPE